MELFPLLYILERLKFHATENDAVNDGILFMRLRGIVAGDNANDFFATIPLPNRSIVKLQQMSGKTQISAS